MNLSFALLSETGQNYKKILIRVYTFLLSLCTDNIQKVNIDGGWA